MSQKRQTLSPGTWPHYMSRTGHRSSLRCFLWQMTTWHRDRARDRAIITNYTDQFLRDIMLLVTHRLSRWCCDNMLWSGVKYLDTIINGIHYICGGWTNTSQSISSLPMSDNNTWYRVQTSPRSWASITSQWGQVSVLINLLQPWLSLPHLTPGRYFGLSVTTLTSLWHR